MLGLGKKEQSPDFECFVIYDSKSQTYGTMMLEKNHHVMIRELTNMMQDPQQQAKNPYYVNAEDFSLFRNGTYDKRTGIVSGQNLEHIVNFHDLRSLIQREKTVNNTQMGIGPT